MSLYAQNTKVPIGQTRAEIEHLLERGKAKQYGTAVDYDLGIARVQFKLQERIVRFTIELPDRKKMGDGVRFERAERQRWRALLLVIKAKLESVENHIEGFEEAFMSQIVMPDDKTVGQHVRPQIAEAYKAGKMPKQLGPAQV